MKNYEERLREVVKITGKPYFLTEKDIWEILLETKPVAFDGHFEFHGFHSDMYLRMQTISQYPYFLTKISNEIIAWARDSFQEFDVVLAPSSQGMYFAYDLASKTEGVRAVYAKIEPETGRPTGEFPEGFEINTGENIIIVNDINVTGASLFKLIKLVEDNGAKVLGICVFADMGKAEMLTESIKRRYLFHSVISLNIPFWSKGVCSRKCDEKKPLVTMQQINHLPIYPGDVAYESFLKKIEAKNKL